VKNKKICLVGLGYVGLPLAVAFAKKFQVVGFDIDNVRIQELKSGHDKTFEIEDDLLQSVKHNIIYTDSIQDAKDCSIYIVTVPTPIDSMNRPDLTPLVESSKTVVNKCLNRYMQALEVFKKLGIFNLATRHLSTMNSFRINRIYAVQEFS
jgi:UDP-N-acetyl-D-mannosaminuronate dehydrogenase